jgi:NADH-quinone oxidoreductase subunit F
MPVRAFIKNFREEFEYHINHKRCMVAAGGYSSSSSHDALLMAAE